MNTLAYPKPKDIKKTPEPIFYFSDGREKVNLKTKEGRDIYASRKKTMLERQKGVCCLYGIIKICLGRLALVDAMFEHEDGRTSGHYDDRIEVPDPKNPGKMKRKNGVAHAICNSLKGSRRIPYNDAP